MIRRRVFSFPYCSCYVSFVLLLVGVVKRVLILQDTRLNTEKRCETDMPITKTDEETADETSCKSLSRRRRNVALFADFCIAVVGKSRLTSNFVLSVFNTNFNIVRYLGFNFWELFKFAYPPYVCALENCLPMETRELSSDVSKFYLFT